MQEKLTKYFQKKVGKLYHHIIEADYPEYAELLDKVQKERPGDSLGMRNLFFKELEKYPELKEKMGWLTFPKLSTVILDKTMTLSTNFEKSNLQLLRDETV